MDATSWGGTTTVRGSVGRLAAVALVLAAAVARTGPVRAAATPVTRAAFAAMLAAAGDVPQGTVGPPFADVPPGSPDYQAVEAVTGLDWMTGVAPTRFAPDAPIARGTALQAAVAFLGLTHVAADEATAPLPYADAAEIPADLRGDAAVDAHLGLLPAVDGRLETAAPLTPSAAAALVRRLEALTTADVQAEAARVIAYVHVVPASAVVEAGGTLTLRAYAHDAQGYVLPARFTWRASRGTLETTAADAYEGLATLTVPTPGPVWVTATAVGTGVGATAIVEVTQATRLALGPLPPAVLADQALPVTVRVLTAQGTVDAGAQGLPVAVEVRPAGGVRPPVVLVATTEAGAATVVLPALAPGRYGLTVTAPGTGLPPVRTPLASVAAPVGRLALHVRGGPPAVASGAAVDVDAEVYGLDPAYLGTRWPISVAVTGTEDTLPHLVGESAPPPTAVLGVASAEVPAAGGPAAVVDGVNPGTAEVTVEVPGGALAPASLTLSVEPSGRFGATATAGTVLAGQPAWASVRLLGPDGAPTTASAGGAPVYLEPIDPAGHPLPYVLAQVAGGLARASFVPRQAGTWTLRWRAEGYPPVSGGTLRVQPGPPAQLVVDPTPTSVLLPGQVATLRAWLADRFGNPTATPFRLQVAGAVGSAGVLHLVAGEPTGPAVAGTFAAAAQAPAEETEVVTFASPDHPGFGTATVTFRVVPHPADRLAGKGLWLVFPDWRQYPDATLLAWARETGATHLYLEVATSRDGFYGGRALDDFLPKAHAAGLAVIAWIYAGLEDPARDLAILQEVARYTTPTGDRADGVALDLEEVLTPSVVAAYARAARAAEGPDGLVVAVTYPPAYGPPTPFGALAPYVQAFAPMDYWHILEGDYTYDFVYKWVASSVATVRRLTGSPTAPVEVIAQTYDAFAPSGTGIFSPIASEVEAAMYAAADTGAVGVSFYRPATATAAELQAMASPWEPSAAVVGGR